MKRALSLLLVLVMLLSLCACSKNEAQNTDPSTNSSQATTDNTEESTNSTTEDEHESSENSTTTPSEDEEETTKQPSLEGDKQESIEKPITAPTESTQSPTGESTTTSTETPTTKPTTCEHTYTVATCTIPKICTKCEEIGGHTLPHTYKNGSCTVCGRAEILVTVQEGDWVANIVKAGTGEQGEILSQYILSQNRQYENIVCYSNASACVMNLGKVIYNEKTYYADFYPTTVSSCNWEENGDTITITVGRENNAFEFEFVLKKTSETQLTVISSTNTAYVPVGIVFVKQ